MSLSTGQKALLKTYQLEYRASQTGDESTLTALSAENDVAVAALAASHVAQRVRPASYSALSSYLKAVGLTPPL